MNKKFLFSIIRAGMPLIFMLPAIFLSSAWAGDVPVIAVADFDCETGSIQGCRLAGQAAERLTTNLVRTGDMQVVERFRLQKILMEHKFSVSGLVDTANVSLLGKLVAADYMVIGNVSQLSDNWACHMRLVEIVSGKIFYADSMEAPDERKFLSAIQEKADQMTAQLRRIQKGSFTLTFLVNEKGAGKKPLSEKDKKLLLDVLARKAKYYGASTTDVSQDGARITVAVSGISEPLELASLLMQNDMLEFRLADIPFSKDSNPKPGYSLFPYENSLTQTIFVRNKIELTGDHIQNSSVSVGWLSGSIFLIIKFDGAGTRRFSSVTGSNIGKALAVVLNGKVLMAPMIQERIAGGIAQITGMFDMESAFRLSVNLKSGRLPAEISLEGIEKK
jgi:TolB-like protein